MLQFVGNFSQYIYYNKHASLRGLGTLRRRAGTCALTIDKLLLMRGNGVVFDGSVNLFMSIGLKFLDNRQVV